MRRRPLALTLGLLVLFAPMDDARTQPADGDLASAITELVDAAGLGDQLGLDIRDASTGRVLFQLRADVARNPASNMKIATAAAALERLGADARFHTGVYGRVEGGAVRDLVLEGHGDPSLTQDDLLSLARQVADRGVRSVERVLVDADHFDDRLLPPAFEQQPNETAYFRAAVGGIVADQATFTLRVQPGAVGENAATRLRGAGYFEVTGNVATVAEEGSVVLGARALPDGRMRLRLGGSIKASEVPSSFRQRVENPVLYAGFLFSDALSSVGVRGTRNVSTGAQAAERPLLADHASPPLSQLLYAVGKHSDNFVAEMVLKQLGARPGVPATSEAGAAVVKEYLEGLGVPAGSFTVVNGSGLFRGNRIAPAHLSTVLVRAYRTPAIRGEFIAHLAIGGVDGTLEHRFERHATDRAVRAKTGTLNDVIALSGYVLAEDPTKTLAFSFIANGVAGKGLQTRQLFDAIVELLYARVRPAGAGR